MKLVVEHHPELVNMSRYFKRIEDLATRMGIKPEELVEEKNSMRVHRGGEALINEERKQVFKAVTTLRVVKS
ncbi:MAG: hypothetical protein RL065_1907 [Bacteroidota bacterium]